MSRFSAWRLAPLGAFVALAAAFSSSAARARAEDRQTQQENGGDAGNAARAAASARGPTAGPTGAPNAAPEPSGPVIDPATLTARAGRPRASDFPLRACSFRHALCVHATKGTGERRVLATLASEERAWDTATGALDFPAPDPDPTTRAYDVYLTDPGAPEGAPRLGAETAMSERDGRGGYDRASAFTRVDRRLEGCVLDHAVARELFRAILFRVSPAIDEGSAIAQTTSLAELAAPCTPIDSSLFQAHPERALADTWPEAPRDVGARFDEGASLEYDAMDARFGAEPGAIVRGLWALSPTVTPSHAWRWNDEPDTFDVLRVSFRNVISTGSTVDDLHREMAIARAFADPRPNFEWSIDWPSTARRITSSRGIAPTGISYVTIRRDGAPKGSRLRLESTWEEHARMRWTVVKVDAQGHEMGEIPVPTPERATETQMTVVDLDDVGSLLLVAVNAGDPFYPFDPDDEVWEPHGWLLTVASE